MIWDPALIRVKYDLAGYFCLMWLASQFVIVLLYEKEQD